MGKPREQEQQDQRELEFDNPLARAGGSDDAGEQPKVAGSATFESEAEDTDQPSGVLRFDDNMLQDLVFAFEACDVTRHDSLRAPA